MVLGNDRQSDRGRIDDKKDVKPGQGESVGTRDDALEARQPVHRWMLWTMTGLAGLWLTLNWFGYPIPGGWHSSGYGDIPARFALSLMPIVLTGWGASALGAALLRVDDSRYVRAAVIAAALAPLPYIAARLFLPDAGAVSATPFFCLIPWLYLAAARRVPAVGFLYFAVLVTWAHFLAGDFAASPAVDTVSTGTGHESQSGLDHRSGPAADGPGE